jgi:hypothetical protein
VGQSLAERVWMGSARRPPGVGGVRRRGGARSALRLGVSVRSATASAPPRGACSRRARAAPQRTRISAGTPRPAQYASERGTVPRSVAGEWYEWQRQGGGPGGVSAFRRSTIFELRLRWGPAADDRADGVVGDDGVGEEGCPGQHGDGASRCEPPLYHVALVRVPVLGEHRVRHDLRHSTTADSQSHTTDCLSGCVQGRSMPAKRGNKERKNAAVHK